MNGEPGTPDHGRNRVPRPPARRDGADAGEATGEIARAPARRRGREAGRRPSRILFHSGIATVGAFRAEPGHPLFPDSGPIEAPQFVFPRTSVVIRHEDKPPFATDTRTVTFYNEGQRYTRGELDPRGDRCEWFALRPDVVRATLARRDAGAADRQTAIFPFARGVSDRRSYLLQRLLVRHLEESDDVDPLRVEEFLIGLLDHVAGLAYDREQPPGAPSREPGTARGRARLARRARDVLRERFTSSFTLDELAEALGASVAHLCRVFKQETGTTLHRYRSELRLRRSLELVAGCDDLSRVAFGLGYSSHSHFTAAFRRAFSLTPSEFRRQASSRRLGELREVL